MKRKWKLYIAGGILCAIISVAFISAIITTIETIIFKNTTMQNLETDDEGIDLDSFEIKGTKDGNNYNLTFDFETWQIKGIQIKLDASETENIKTIVEIPNISGSRPSMAYQFLRQKGFTKEGACGLMANINSESAGTWRSNIEEGSKPYQGRIATNQGYGICQWTNGRRTKVIDYLSGLNFNVEKDSKAAFLAELEYTITEKGYESIANEMRTQTDVTTATRIWCTKWEKPQNMYAQSSIRAKTAKKYLKKYGDKSGYEGQGKRKVELKLNYTKDKDTVTFEGTLDEIDIAGTLTVKDNKIKGDGKYGDGATLENISTTAGGGSMAYPLPKEYPITSGFGWRGLFGGNYHGGIDLGAGTGEKILAAKEGIVIISEYHYSWGNHVLIKHNSNLYTNYAHMSKILVKKGQKVKTGDVIGLVGSTGRVTGPHLHFEVWKNSSSKSRVNPKPYIYK